MDDNLEKKKEKTMSQPQSLKATGTFYVNNDEQAKSFQEINSQAEK